MPYLTFDDTWNKKFVNLSEYFTPAFTIGNSQNGEDGLVNEIFNRCQPLNKWCVDIGCGDGWDLSNTGGLIKKGWNGVLIDNDPKLINKAKERYKNNKKVIVIRETITENNLEPLLEKTILPHVFDFLSIDIDSSYDDKVWDNLTNYEANLVCVEYDPQGNFDTYGYRDHDVTGGPVGGIGLGTIMELAKKKDYEFMVANICNVFFIKPEFSKPLLV